MCVCLCVRVCVWLCACVCVCECPWLQRAKDHLKDLPIMDHVFVKQSCGNYVSINYVGKTVAASGVGRGRCWKDFKSKVSDRIWKIQITEKRLPESSTPQHMRYLNRTPRISLPPYLSHSILPSLSNFFLPLSLSTSLSLYVT